jgi:proline iminopeptidase
MAAHFESYNFYLANAPRGIQIMLRYIFLFALIMGCAALPAQRSTASVTKKIDGIFVSTFGDSTKQPIIFIHGGPGFNAKDFEVTTAEKLAELGFFVVSYDERGQGRSDATESANFTYRQYADDLAAIIAILNIEKPILIGHSHGGPIAIKFDEQYPALAKAIILVGAPVNFCSSMESLYSNCAERYKVVGHDDYAKELSAKFEILAAQKKGSKDLIAPTGSLFMHGLFGCRLYQTANPTKEEQELRKIMKENPAPMEQHSMPGFLVNESYIYRDHFSQVRMTMGRYFGIYGDEDGLLTSDVLAEIRNAVGESRFHLVKGSSHAVYVDQQADFLKTVKEIALSLE